MLVFKHLLMLSGVALIVVAAAIVAYDFFLKIQFRRAAAGGVPIAKPEPVRWRMTTVFFALAWAPMLIAASIAVVSSGEAGVRVSETSGTLSGTLYPGVHFVTPVLEHVETFDTRDKLFTTGVAEDAKAASGHGKGALTVQAKEGLSLGLAITVRYRLDPKRLDYIQSHLPQPVETELVPPVVASAWREVAPNYTVREMFSAKREEVRQRAAGIITAKLAKDGVIVEEVMLRDIQLPPEYAKGLEDLLLKEQQNDQLSVQTEMQQKQVRISELEAEADKARSVKQAEGAAQVKVLEAKGEADAMQYTLPLKEKQIQQSKLEAEARKESTIKNAEAAAEAKVIDSKAELQRRNMLADAEANRIRVTASADAERLRQEAAVLKQNPLLINKIVAEKLSDKIQVMMVPSDGKFFFANDVMKSFGAPGSASSEEAEPQGGSH
ncbi:SPFH domain, Band 7 family protein [Candidatus Koribacter versatilis Ellin345]|uniref:SPFH domain, Band 7 family protein n=1 Tax=Koribacter versatilis (strain Ellin345) TaxID=204669 RepID=Q1IQW9_KORVE|nr:SPFH domain-containing protein [Candidatus Koribacter versatilis]ABF40731.1 SPFH domain, Band 7 family protein [Candidatus Koribacter versatilis Ellin345]